MTVPKTYINLLQVQEMKLQILVLRVCVDCGVTEDFIITNKYVPGISFKSFKQ